MKVRFSCMALVLLCLCLAQQVSANVFFVPTPACPNLRAAIEMADSGDTIRLLDGVYTGPDNRDITVVGKSLDIESINGPENCIFDAEGTGPPILAFEPVWPSYGSITLNGITFRNCAGSAVTMNQCSTGVINCRFTNNGAGLYFRNCFAQVFESLFQSNSSGLLAEASFGNITACTFEHNSSAGAYLPASGNMDIVSSMFSRNTVGLISSNTYIFPTQILNCTFSENRRGLYAEGLTVADGCNFIANLPESGARISDNVTLRNCYFERNVAYFSEYGGPEQSYGGGVEAYGNVSLQSCRFTSNSSNKLGGGLYHLGGSLALQDCTFTGNSAIYGGGLSGLDEGTTSTSMENCVFDSNEASYGGGALLYSYRTSSVRNCRFDNNRAGQGGGLSITGSAEVENCRFTTNLAYQHGGGIATDHADLDPYSKVRLVNCLITSNTASVNGGGVYVYSGKTELLHATLFGNTAGSAGGGLHCEGGEAAVTNSILWNDVAPSASEISAGYILPVTYCDVQSGYPGTGNTDLDPLFVNAALGDFHLQADSPCIDSATFRTPYLPATDFEGNQRLMGDAPDRGVYETAGTLSAAVSGVVTLGDIVGYAPAQPIIFTFRPMDGSEDIVRVAPITITGDFSIASLPRKNYLLHIKGAKWLAANRAADMTGGDVFDINAFLTAGDGCEDNSIDVFDLDALITAFDAIPYSPNWNENADFNCDGAVDVFDLDILIRNFDAQGDE